MWQFIIAYLSFAVTFKYAELANSTVDCTNEDIVTSIFNAPIPLTLEGTILIYENVTINSLISTANNEFDKNYIDARLVDDVENGSTHLEIRTTEHFVNYAKEQTAVRITLKIVLGCGMGRERTLIFFQPLEDGNYYTPTFTKDLYEIRVPLPLYAGFDLTTFTEITARDDDLVSNQIEFISLDAERYHIAVDTKSGTVNEDGKTYAASLKLKLIYISLPEALRFQITARDHGNPPRNSTATIVIRADPDNSLPVTPQFERNVYYGTLSTQLTLSPLQMKLRPGTNISQVVFTKSGIDEHFFNIQTTNSGVEVNLSQTLTLADVREREYFQMKIIVQHQQLAEQSDSAVLISVPNLNDSFHFEKTVYTVQIDNDDKLQMREIIFVPFEYEMPIAYEIQGPGQQYMSVKEMNNALILSLTDEYNREIWRNQTYLSLELMATLEHLMAKTLLLIEPTERTSVPNLEIVNFEKSSYMGTINRDHLLNTEKIVLKTNLIFQRENVTLTGNESKHFDVFVNGNEIRLEVKPSTIFENLDSIIVLQLKVQGDNWQSQATIVIEVQRTLNSTTERLFSRTWYVGQITKDLTTNAQSLLFDDITLRNDENITDYEFDLNGAQSTYFKLDPHTEKNHIDLDLVENIPAEILNTKNQIYLELSVKRISNASIFDAVPVFIELPHTNCSEPSLPMGDSPVFESNAYIFAAEPNKMGPLGQVTATVPGTNATLRYSLTVQNEHLQKRISINPDHGELLLLSAVSAGIYYFRINVERSDKTSGRASVEARLEVDALLQCAQQEVSAAHALLVKHIEEEQMHSNLLNVNIPGSICHWLVFHMQPDDQRYVYINDSSKMLVAIAIDREAVSHVQVQLRLDCAAVESNVSVVERSVNKARSANTDLLFVEDILYSQDRTILNLVIVDINDNAPVFVQPNVIKCFGYPERNISFELFPSYLTQVQAIDADEGLNALIRYSIESNEHFDIEPETGIIYPKGQALQTAAETVLHVQATDCDGAANGLSTEIWLVVKRLSAKHYTLLTLGGVEKQSLNELITEMSLKTGYDITIVREATLTSDVVRGEDEQRKRRQVNANDGLVQQAWIYAFNGSEPVLCDDLKRKILSKVNATELLTMQSYEDVGLTTQPLDQAMNNVIIYIVFIAILSVLCCACIGFMLWRFWVKENTKCSNESDNSTVIAPTGVSTNFNGCATADSYKSKTDNGITHTTSSTVRCDANGKREDDKSETKETGKSERPQVTFNESVERIQIDSNEPSGCN